MEARQLPAVPLERLTFLPDRGVLNYVTDLLQAVGLDVALIQEKYPHWLPVGVVGTLDWVAICGWWIFRNTGFFDSDEGYRFIIEFNDYEFDPDMILVFREELARSKFSERIDNPGIESIERTEALQFLREDVYGHWARSKSLDPDSYVPPQQFLELVMWATFVWVMSEYGRDWIYNQDEVLACVIEYGVAFVEKWTGESTLLDPEEVRLTQRPVSTCRYCGQSLWCVRGAWINGTSWYFTCINCMVEQWESGAKMDLHDERLIHPKCPHKTGIEGGAARSCAATCPHSGIDQEKLWSQMQSAGSERLARYRQAVKMAGGTPRELAGQTDDELINYFRRQE